MSRSSITVGVSTLDRPAGLQRCLDALIAGRQGPDEVIVVDQGTDAQTEAVAASCAGAVRVEYIRQARRGLSASRNAVLRAAHGAIIAVTDDDCVPESGWLAGLARAFDRTPKPDAVSGRVLALPADGTRMYAVSLRTSTSPVDFIGDTTPWLVGTGANFAVRRDVLLRLGGYDERFGAGSAGQAAEDLELSVRLLRAGGRIRYEPDAIVYHERQCRTRRMATRWSYGHGIGALGGMLCGRRDRHGLAILAASSSGAVRRLLRAMLRGNLSGIHQAMLSLRGTARGIPYGWRIGSAERRAGAAEQRLAQ